MNTRYFFFRVLHFDCHKCFPSKEKAQAWLKNKIKSGIFREVQKMTLKELGLDWMSDVEVVQCFRDRKERLRVLLKGKSEF